MKPKKEKVVRSASAMAAAHRIEHEAEGGALGAIGGAVLGSAAGLPGALAGAVMGGIAGAMAGGAVDSESSDHAARTKKLDAEIGVIEGDIGAPNLEHPPSRPPG
jgi:outer membrane lipoprotein SlyB